MNKLDFVTHMPQREFEYHVHISERNAYIYFEVPKAGSTTIKSTLQAFETLTMGMTPLSKENAVIHNKKLSPLLSPFNIGIEKFCKMLDDDTVFKFGFVRNPYTRMLSAFLNKMGWMGPQKKVISDILSLSKEDEISFAQFVQAVTSQSPFDMDPHWRPQTSQLFYDLVNYHFIGRFENFDEDFKTVLDKIAASSPHQEQAAKAANQLVVERRGQKTGANSKCKDFYSDDLRDSVYVKYEEDFRHFSYSATL